MPPKRSMSWPPTPLIDERVRNQTKFDKRNDESTKRFKEYVMMREEWIKHSKAYNKADEQIIEIRNKNKKSETARSQVARSK